MYIYSNLYTPGCCISAVCGSGVCSGRLFETHRGYIGHFFILLFILFVVAITTIVTIVTIVITTMYHTTIAVTPTTMFIIISSVSSRGEGFLIVVEDRPYI